MATGASEYYYIPELDKDGKRARLEAMTDTSSRGGLSSSVQMQFADQTGPNFTFEMCGDFRKIVLSTKNLRGTQKAINTHHSMAFTPESVQALKAVSTGVLRSKNCRSALI